MPRLIFARALPVGVESLMETVVVELDGRIAALDVMKRLNQTLPPEIEIVEAKEVALSFSESPVPDRSVYWIPLDRLLPKEEAVARLGKAFEKSELFIHQERKGKKRRVDVLPLIESMELKEKEESSGNHPGWGVELALRSALGRTAKPSEIIGAILGLEGESLAKCEIMKME